MDLCSLEEAKSQGLRYFFTGLPCKKGHTAQRYVNARYICVECERARSRIKQKTRRLKDPEGENAKRRAWRAANLERERTKERIRETRRKPRDAQKKRQYFLNWIKKDPERARVLAVERSTRYAKRYPEKHAAVEANRRARKFSGRCSCCSNAEIIEVYKQARLIDGEVDHTIPLALGGLHCIKNLKILTKLEHKEKTKNDLSVIVSLQHRNEIGQYTNHG